MAKSFFLLLCCAFLSRSLWAQATKPDTLLQQKLQIKKAALEGQTIQLILQKRRPQAKPRIAPGA